MPKLKNKPSGQRKSLAIGQRGIVRFGNSTMQVEVIEDRGPIGFRGARLVRVRVIQPASEADTTFEIPADAVHTPRSRVAAIGKNSR